ncbi:aldo/keto reductase [Pseudoduganella albidiflava]|uniref:Aldo/keto reductase n=1 Tax=Pseudoduganella albidiflava TaxID=321983 RepID=A0A411WZL3_9BURK|nr:aldo/keto reductase [Pseudoduganella albidiflava]QBI02138.1 aldo/keto reductase [Pseudoduganella albidiflava]GGY60227.1 oxidoreductase [Pseudoduganella albidiflava]
MHYKSFGRRSGLRVSALALGTGNFGTGWGYGSEREEARAVFDRYVEAGGNFIDTADGYQGGQSEVLTGDFIAADRDHFVLATKFTLSGPGGISGTGNSRKAMVQSVEASLKRLKTDRIDLYWAHFADDHTPMDELLRAFDDLVRSGKILYAGLSNFPAWRIARADAIAELRGWAPLVGVQMEYSLAERGADRELLPMIEGLGLGGALWSPLGGGLLTGKYRNNEEGRLQGFGGRLVHREDSERATATLDAVLAVAAEVDAPPAQVAIAWLLHRDAASSTALVPILGPRTPAQLDGTLGALDVTLSPDQLARLDAASAIQLGAPYDTIAQTAGAIAGGQPGLLLPRKVPVA